MSKNKKELLSAEEARNEIRRQGITIKEWARQRALDSKTVFEVLGGRKKGKWGEAHKAAVLLGMKDGII